MRKLFAALVFGVGMTGAATAMAAPFCVVRSYGDECYYWDMPSCRQAAAAAQSTCVVQQEGTRPSVGLGGSERTGTGAPFCVVQSYGRQCWYYDAPSCQRDAAQSGGACVVNPDR